MRDPDKTRQTILQEASKLFNTQGYKATSLSDITKATGLTKGAIYRHFEDKAQLERQSFLYMSDHMMRDVRTEIKTASTAPLKLEAVLRYFSAYSRKPPFIGGCPLMNAAIEVDDANPILKQEVQRTMASIHAAICHVIKNGIAHEQLAVGINVKSMASIIISSLEGGIMMGKLSGSNQHLKSVIEFLRIELKKHALT